MGRKPAPRPNPVDLPADPQPEPTCGRLTIRDACQRLKCGRTYLYGLMNSGKLPYLVEGDRRFFTPAILDKYIRGMVMVLGPARKRSACGV